MAPRAHFFCHFLHRVCWSSLARSIFGLEKFWAGVAKGPVSGAGLGLTGGFEQCHVNS